MLTKKEFADCIYNATPYDLHEKMKGVLAGGKNPEVIINYWETAIS